MADTEVLLSIALLLLSLFLYGLKWAVLIGITIFLCTVFLNYRGYKNAVKNRCEHSDIDSSLYTANSDAFYAGSESSAYETTAVRRNTTLTQDMPFSDIQMHSRQPRPARNCSSLRSPEPLLSQVTRHLSFNNTSYYYPDRTRLNLSSNDKSILNPSTGSLPVGSCMSSKWYTPLGTTLSQQGPLLQERYSPRQFSVISPQSGPHNTSTVKICHPGDGDNDSRFALESILHKRLERTKDNPCSRQSVLSALGQKSRKRSAHDSDMVESYSVKKRRRDDLDDFLDAVNNPLSSPTAPYTGVKSIKRPYSDSISEKPTLEITRKRTKDNQTDSQSSSPLRNSTISAFEDSGVDVSSPHKTSQENILTQNSQAKVVQPVKLRKRKSVTFSDKLPCATIVQQSPPKEKLTAEDGKIQDAKNLNKDSQEDYSQVFHIGFSPRKSLTPEYLSSISNRTESKKSPRRRRRSNITWKDLEENRREAWRRSQKLLDEIEESLSKEIESTPSLVVTIIPVTTVTSSMTSTITSLPTSTVSSTGLQTMTDQVQTQNTSVAGNVPVQASQMKATSLIGSNTLFVHTELKNTPQSGITGGSTGTTDGFTFAVPKNSPKSSSTTGLFGGTSNAAAVPLAAPSLLSGNTSSKANATSQQSFSFQNSASQPTTSTLSTFSLQTSTQATAPVTQNTTAGLFKFNTGSGASIVGSRVQTSNPTATTSSITQPKAGGFSFSAPAVTAANVRGGFMITTQVGEKTTAQNGFTITAPTTEKPNTSGGVSFTVPTADKPKVGSGFTFTAPTAEKPNTSGGFAFTAPTSDKQNASGAFSFTAPTAEKPKVSGGFTFNAPATGKVSGSGGFQFTAPAVNNGGFAFNASVGNKPSNSGGFNFENQNTPATFNFGSPLPAPTSGINFAGGFVSSTPIPTNSGRANNTSAKARQRRRQKR